MTEVVLATGVTPRNPPIAGADVHRGSGRVLGYADVLLGRHACGPSVAVIGAGASAFDVAEFPRLVQAFERARPRCVATRMGRHRSRHCAQRTGSAGAGTIGPPGLPAAAQGHPARQGLGKTTGWIHRAAQRMKRVEMIGGVNYERIDERGCS
jgi:2,4-dienoyl-CoA reductase (NADPH2)